MPEECRPPRSPSSRTPPVDHSNHSGSPAPAPPVAEPTQVPGWLLTDWSHTAFTIPVFHGTFNPGSQIEWACKNATVAIHDAFNEVSWAHIGDKAGAVYLAVCDVVLQRKEHASVADNGEGDLPYYPQWKAARDADIDEVFAWARRDLQCYIDTELDVPAARRVGWRALNATFCVYEDAESGPPDDEPLDDYADLAVMLGEFAPQPSVLDRYGLWVLQTTVGDEPDESIVNRELTAWTAAHGPMANMFPDKGLRGLPRFPRGYVAPRPDPTVLAGTGWVLADL